MEIFNKAANLFFSIIRGLAQAAFRLAGRELTEETWQKIEQFVKFCLVGVTNTLISYVVHCVVLLLIEGKVPFDYMIASTCGFVVSVLNAFILNNRFVFRSEHTSRRDILLALLKTYASYAFTGLLLNYVFLYLLCDVAGISKYIAPLLIVVVTTPINFVLNKFWAFRKSKANEKKEK